MDNNGNSNNDSDNDSGDEKVKRIIFLDVDGVLNCQPPNFRTAWPDYERGDERAYGLNPQLVANLKKVIDETKAKIVVSSSWRYFDDYFTFNSDLMWRDVLAHRMGYEAKDLFIGNTPPSLVEYAFRGGEIMEWMETNEYKYGVAGKDYKFCIVDDEVRSILDVFDPRYVLHTDYRRGLTAEDAEKAIHILETA